MTVTITTDLDFSWITPALISDSLTALIAILAVAAVCWFIFRAMDMPAEARMRRQELERRRIHEVTMREYAERNELSSLRWDDAHHEGNLNSEDTAKVEKSRQKLAQNAARRIELQEMIAQHCYAK